MQIREELVMGVIVIGVSVMDVIVIGVIVMGEKDDRSSEWHYTRKRFSHSPHFLLRRDPAASGKNTRICSSHTRNMTHAYVRKDLSFQVIRLDPQILPNRLGSSITSWHKSHSIRMIRKICYRANAGRANCNIRIHDRVLSSPFC